MVATRASRSGYTQHNTIGNIMTNYSELHPVTQADFKRLALMQALDTILWSSPALRYEDDDECMDAVATVHDFDGASLERVEADLFAFIDANAADIADMDYSDVGHNYVLSRDRHGTGFWDRDLGERGERLHEAASVGTFEAYLVLSDEENGVEPVRPDAWTVYVK